MTAEQLTRKRGRRFKHPPEIMAAVLNRVATTDQTIKEICEELGVHYSTGRTWVKDAREKLGSQVTSPAPNDQPASACKSGQSEGIVPGPAKETEQR